ncbi:MAG: cupin domain-containing protein [Xanthomonadales bacterium]|nr:cupin domain-containing protein [Xanthomonadales bacterium]
MQTVMRIVACAALSLPALVSAQGLDYSPVVRDALRQSSGKGALNFRILVDAANLGGEETRIAELTLSQDYVGHAHTHGTIEIFYVISGRFGHNVNGEMSVLEPGEIAIYRPGDTIIHSVEGDEPVVLLTIWLPGGATAPFHAP